MTKTDIEFIFDVDGTLTPSRQSIDTNFKQWFIDFCGVNNTYLVSGSDYSKTLEQLGEHICSLQKRIYSCSGNEVREKGVIVKSSTWKPEANLIDFLNNELAKQLPYVYTVKSWKETWEILSYFQDTKIAK